MPFKIFCAGSAVFEMRFPAILWRRFLREGLSGLCTGFVDLWFGPQVWDGGHVVPAAYFLGAGAVRWD